MFLLLTVIVHCNAFSEISKFFAFQVMTACNMPEKAEPEEQSVSGKAADATTAGVQRPRTRKLRARLRKEVRARMLKLERNAQKMTVRRTLRRKPNLCKVSQRLSRQSRKNKQMCRAYITSTQRARLKRKLRARLKKKMEKKRQRKGK